MKSKEALSTDKDLSEVILLKKESKNKFKKKNLQN